MAMANGQTHEQAKTADKTHSGAASKPTSRRTRQPRRRDRSAPSGEASQSEPVAVTAATSETTAENDTAPITGDEPAAGPSVLLSMSADTVSEVVPGSDRNPSASTKRAVLIGMLERAEGASVTVIGQRLGWLPHTVRAAITGLRHAGHEVTRSKDQDGQSVYRFVSAETRDR